MGVLGEEEEMFAGESMSIAVGVVGVVSGMAQWWVGGYDGYGGSLLGRREDMIRIT